MTERKETSLTRLASAVMTSESVKEGADRLLRFTRSLSTCTELEQCEWVGCLELNLREAGFLTDIEFRTRNQWCIAPASEAVCRYLVCYLGENAENIQSLSRKARQLNRFYLAPGKPLCSRGKMTAVMDSICDACGLTEILKNTGRLEIILLPDVAKSGSPFVLLTDWTRDNRAHRVHLALLGMETTGNSLSQLIEDAAAGIVAVLVLLCFAERSEPGVALKDCPAELSSVLTGDAGAALYLLGHGLLCKMLDGFRKRLMEVRPEERESAEPLADVLIAAAREKLLNKNADRRMVI